MSKQTKSDIQKKAMIVALEKALGIVTTACKQVGIHRSTHYEWYNTDDQYKHQVDSVADVTLDFAESQLHKQINGGNTSATIFYLKTKGKKRGYIEKQEVEIIKDDVDLTGFTEDEIRKFIDELDEPGNE